MAPAVLPTSCLGPFEPSQPVDSTISMALSRRAPLPVKLFQLPAADCRANGVRDGFLHRITLRSEDLGYMQLCHPATLGPFHVFAWLLFEGAGAASMEGCPRPPPEASGKEQLGHGSQSHRICGEGAEAEPPSCPSGMSVYGVGHRAPFSFRDLGCANSPPGTPPRVGSAAACAAPYLAWLDRPRAPCSRH